MKRVILIGDSIRMGYESTVRDELRGRADVISPKENGGNSEKVLEHLDVWILAHAPAVVHLNCGLHDIKKDFESGSPAIDLDAYAANLRAIFRRVMEADGCTLIWASTTPVNEERHHAVKGFDRFEADVAAYNRTAADITTEFGVPTDDLFAVVMDAGRDRMLTPDGVHYVAEGSELLGKAVAAYLEPYLGDD